VVIEPLPLEFDADWEELAPEGVPIVELVMRAFVGRCQVCGSDAEDQTDGSVLTNLVQLDGTVYGDTFCAGCIDTDEIDSPISQLPPLPAEWEDE
jgi:hypothetical protein